MRSDVGGGHGATGKTCPGLHDSVIVNVIACPLRIRDTLVGAASKAFFRVVPQTRGTEHLFR